MLHTYETIFFKILDGLENEIIVLKIRFLCIVSPVASKNYFTVFATALKRQTPKTILNRCWIFSWAMSHICANDEYRFRVGATNPAENIISYLSVVSLSSICM
jgi:hypothetical protein